MNVVIGDNTAVYIRVACLAIAVYDFLITLPAEWRIYRAQRFRTRLSISCGLFIAIRYTSVALVVMSSYTFFYHRFTVRTCEHWYLVPASMKVVQIMVTQAVMAWRMYIVSQRKRIITWFISGFYLLSCAAEWVTSLLNRVYDLDGNCQSVNVAAVPTAWLYYVIAAIFDVVTTVTVVFYLVRLHPKTNLMSRLKKLLMYHGLGYFFALTVVNLFNILIFLSNRDQMQSAAAPVSYTLTWIFSQKLLIHLNDISLKEKAKAEETVETIIIVVSRTIESGAGEDNSGVVQTSCNGEKDSYDVDVNVTIRTSRRSSRSPDPSGSV